LANTIDRYFDSRLFRDSENARMDIQAFGNSNYSWQEVAKIIHPVYDSMMK
jgi:hypothetical protein